MATVRIADGIHPIRSNDGTSSALAGGVYPIRTPSLVDLRATRSRSVERRGVRLHDYGHDDEGLRQEGDFKKKQVWIRCHLALVSLLTRL